MQLIVAADRLLMERHPHTVLDSCATHCIDLMLEDVENFIKEVINQARSISKLIYNHAFGLSLMRRYARNRELLHLAITHFAANFISLQSLLQCQSELKQIFCL